MADSSILIIDNEQDFLDTVKRGLAAAHFREIRLESDSVRAAGFFTQGGAVDVALIDVGMPGMRGVELLELIKARSPETECIMLTAAQDAQTAVECMKKGAYDYLIKPVTREQLVVTVNRALERQRLVKTVDLSKQKNIPALKHREAFEAFTTQSMKMIKLLKEAELHAASDVPVLITGETGTGKELLARAIHRASPRADQGFTPVNMASITPSLFDAEFFGHTKGAFTGAEKERQGYLEHADRGTIFLDEIGTLTYELQGKLLRVLQEQEFFKIGSSSAQKVDIRFLTATNADVEHMASHGTFRKDLLYRLKGAWFHLPPLRERREDIKLLVHAFLDDFCGTGNHGGIQEGALSLLLEYTYPGNIRELKSIIQAAVNLSGRKPITIAALPEFMRRLKSTSRKPYYSPGEMQPLAAAEKEYILKAYEMTARNKTSTANLMGIGLNTLRRKLKAYGVD